LGTPSRSCPKDRGNTWFSRSSNVMTRNSG
jgi:hypothetical protein